MSIDVHRDPDVTYHSYLLADFALRDDMLTPVFVLSPTGNSRLDAAKRAVVARMQRMPCASKSIYVMLTGHQLRSFLDRHETAILVLCGVLFGLGWGLSHERAVVPTPLWYTNNLHRFCIVLMGWTALLHSDPLQRLFWSVTDWLALTSPYFVGILLAPERPMVELIAYEITLGNLSAGATLGVTLTQGICSLLPNWRIAPARPGQAPPADSAKRSYAGQPAQEGGPSIATIDQCVHR